MALELLERRHGLARALPALEAEGLRHDAHGQRARAPRRLGHDGRGPAPRAAAHARRHEDQVRAPDHLLDVGAALDRRRPPHRGLAARAEPPRQHAPDVQAGAPLRLAREGLRVRVDAPEVDAADAGADHPVDRVAAAAPHADHPDGAGP